MSAEIEEGAALRIKQVVWDALVDNDPGMGNPPTEIWNLYKPEGVAIVITNALLREQPWKVSERAT